MDIDLEYHLAKRRKEIKKLKIVKQDFETLKALNEKTEKQFKNDGDDD
jgi:hypothetical protein